MNESLKPSSSFAVFLPMNACSDFTMLSEALKSSVSNKNKIEPSLILIVLRPGFGPGSAAFFHLLCREAAIHGPSTKFDRTILPEHRTYYYFHLQYIFVPSRLVIHANRSLSTISFPRILAGLRGITVSRIYLTRLV